MPAAATYLENESGASLARPELFSLLADRQPGDILVTEQVGRLSRLNAADWEASKTQSASVVLRSSPWNSDDMATAKEDDFAARMLERSMI